MLRAPHGVRMLQYAGSTFHDDRVVLPLRAECRGRVPGIIHRSSDSGATLFVEPAEAVELNNPITGLGGDEIKEVPRIWGGWALGGAAVRGEVEAGGLPVGDVHAWLDDDGLHTGAV